VPKTVGENIARYGMLLDVYGALLSDSGRQVMHLYYNEDLSLAEIAAERKMSRQAVSGALAKQRRLLNGFEAALTLMQKESDMKSGLDKVSQLLKHGRLPEARQEVNRLRRALAED
jgi:predicted DNA-binding protein YlxM (UPF0122 family)